MHVSIGIVTWNDARYLPDLFASLHAQSWKDVTVRIYDNGSADGETIPFLLREEPHWFAARSTKHVSQSVARNHLIRLALERYRGNPEDHAIFLVDSETVWQPDLLETLVHVLESDSTIQAVHPKILRAFSERGDVGTDAIQSDILDSTGGLLSHRWHMCERDAGVMDREQSDHDAQEILPTCGAILIRATALKEMSHDDQVFDEFFSYGGDDLDFAFLFSRCGFRAAYVPLARIHRYRGAAVESKPKWNALLRRHLPQNHAARYSMMNHWILVIKHGTFLDLVFGMIRALFLDSFRVCFLCLRDSAARRAYLSFPLLLPTLWRARKMITSKTVRSFSKIQQTFHRGS